MCRNIKVMYKYSTVLLEYSSYLSVVFISVKTLFLIILKTCTCGCII